MGFEKFCQSCMFPREQANYHNGTEKDGSENVKYCSMCYVDGEFTSPEIQTAQDMQKFVRGVLKDRGVGWFNRWFYTVGIPKLERWKKP